MKAAFLILLGITIWKTCEACSCMPTHPQAQFCKSDFAIVATVRRHMHPLDPYEQPYKLKIRRKFKMSRKAERALKAGRLVTPREDSMCGISLKINETYLISGRVNSLQATVNLCDQVRIWKNVTPRQRKGFRVLYEQGCHCEIFTCMGPYGKCKNMSKKKNTCIWDDVFSPDACLENHGICLLNQKGRCAWARAARLTDCQIKANGRKMLH